MPIMGNMTSMKYFQAPAHNTNEPLAAAHTSLAGALFTSTQQRVLALLFGQPQRSFYLSEMIKRTGSGSGAVQRELKRLVGSGLVSVKRIGNQQHYQANPTAPIFNELCSMMNKTVALVEPLRAALAPLAEHITLALLYGSVAKGTDTANSDIDVLIVAHALTLENIYRILAPVERQLGRRVNLTLYSPEEFIQRKETNNAFLTRVLSGECLVLIDNTHEPPIT